MKCWWESARSLCTLHSACPQRLGSPYVGWMTPYTYDWPWKQFDRCEMATRASVRMTQCTRVGRGGAGSKVGALSAMVPTRRMNSHFDDGQELWLSCLGRLKLGMGKAVVATCSGFELLSLVNRTSLNAGLDWG